MDRPVDELPAQNLVLRGTLTDHGGTSMLLRNGVLDIHDQLDADDTRRIAAWPPREVSARASPESTGRNCGGAERP